MKFKKPEEKQIVDLESDVLSFWKENKIFEESVVSRKEDNLFVFYDGPPFISGLPHYGHLLGSIAKDVIPRYWTMKGKRVERVWGWDAHGLTVENKVQKELGIENRRDIESYGLDQFTQACYEYTSRISGEWQWYIDRIARWVDMENAYKTTDQNYMESVMWAFKQLYDKGLIYEGVRTSLFCTTCGTPVSNFEIAMDNSYKEVEDPAVCVKFKVLSEGRFNGLSLLAWTTTPWTLPSNRALVVDPLEQYSIVEVSGEKVVLASKRMDSLLGDSNTEYKIVEDIKGESLLGLEYEPPYKFFVSGKNEFKVYSFEGMVNMEEGTGIVHSAPGFGEIDTEMGRANDLRIMLAIDDEGHFVSGDNGKNPFEGMFYKKADRYIIADLEERGLMFSSDRIIHRFPYHDRCNTNLIQKAQNSWFVDVKLLKADLIDNNEKINWVPEDIKHGRFAKGIEQAPDWCISRNRFWATPMPVWESDDGDRIVISSVAELEELSGQEIKDLHRPYIDEVIIERDGKVYRRRPEVLDSWFEAGSMPYAQMHYPFENEEKFKDNFPGDYIVEYVGQVRAWFYVMHVLSTALFDSHSFKNVVSTGIMAGNDGRKMSKTYGNYTDPKEIIENIGGDALRLYLMNSPLMVGGNANFDDVELRNKSRNVLNPLWNSAKFFLIYADLHDWKPSDTSDSPHVLDIWIKSRLQSTIKEFANAIESYNVPEAVEVIEIFITDLSTWYVRRSRERLNSGDKNSLDTLYLVLSSLSKVVAPVIPFMAENIHQWVVVPANENSPKSVHLCDFPGYDQKAIDRNSALLEDMEIVRSICSAGNSMRKEHNLPVRQPLSELVLSENLELDNELVELIKEELNIKEISFKEKENGEFWIEKEINQKSGIIRINTEITETLRLEGEYRKLTREIQKLRKDKGLNVGDEVDLVLPDTEDNKNIIEIFGGELQSKVQARKIILGESLTISQ